MFLLHKPSPSWIRSRLESQEPERFSYQEVGATQGPLPAHYKPLGGRVQLGRGPATFSGAVTALQNWRMFDVPGIELCWPSTLIATGSNVAVLIRHLGFWSVNFCRIAYVIDEPGPLRRYGFAYGTLADHVERGEERFVVEWNQTSDAVHYEIRSFSRPNSVWTVIALPFARWLQRRFVDESLAAMVGAVLG